LKKSLALILAGSLTLGSLKLFSQDFELPHETDPFKFIPLGAPIAHVLVETEEGSLLGTWYDPECKVPEDYQKKFEEEGEMLPKNEIFLDFDYDNIPDLSWSEMEELYDEYIQRIELLKKSI